MILHNQLYTPEAVDKSPTVPLHTLACSQRFRYPGSDKVHYIFFIGPDFIRVKRADGWIHKYDQGDIGWYKSVIKVNKNDK